MKADLRVKRTQDSLRQALLRILINKPLESITISELCREAKINRGTFYLHYSDVHGVFERYFEEIVNDLKKSYEEPYFLTNYHIDKIQPKMIRIFHHVLHYKMFYAIVFNQTIPLIYYYKLHDTICSIMEEHIWPILANRPDFPFRFFLSYQSNAIMGILIEWYREDFTTPPEILSQHLLDIVQIPLDSTVQK